MSDKSTVFRGSEKTLRYLDNATDADAREEILDEARKSGLTNPALSLITHKAVYHTGESLSPAAGMAIDKNGGLVVSDEFNHRLIIYDGSGKKLREIGGQGSGDLEFHYPRGLCFDDDENLYVADAWNHRIVVLAPDLTLKKTIGGLGAGEGELDEPVGVAWSSGRLAVLEKSNHRIQLFAKGGAPMGTIGTRGTVAEQEQFYLLKTYPEDFCSPVFEFPTAIAADSAGNLYVADTNNHRIVKVTSTCQADSGYSLPGLRHPTGLSVDKNDNLHVTQFNRGDVRVFSPEGILLYGYTPPGIELPVAIAVNSSTIYVGGGMKASVSVNGFEPDHDATLARENSFLFHFKKAAAQFGAGDFDRAVGHLKLASELPAETRVSAPEFAASLPENDYAFQPGGEVTDAEKTDGFVKILDAFSDTLWEAVSALFDEKLAAVDGYADAANRLERSLIAGAGDEDGFMVERLRAIRKVLNVSSKIKRAFAGIKKLQEFQRRLAFIGIGLPARPERIAAEMRRINGWKKSRGQWYEAAEQAAPSLTFNSGPDEREVFAQNQSRLEMFDFEFRLLWELAGEFNRETASLIRRYGWKLSPLFGDLLFEAVDFLLFCPDNFDSRLEYFHSLEDMFDAAGGEKLSELVGDAATAGQWEALGREDNIPHKTKPEVYRLLPALWSAGGLECAKKPDVETWEKIVDFYHAELERYIDENKPLRTELIRTGGLLSAAERTDPKQAMLIRRKLTLLWFHNYYQERYIGNALIEYLVRFALFHLADCPLSGERRAKTAEKLDRLTDGFNGIRFKADEELKSLRKEMATASGAGESKNPEFQIALLYTPSMYSVNANVHLAAARRSASPAPRKYAGPVFRRLISGTGIDSSSFFKPIALSFDGRGRLHVVLVGSCRIVTFDEEGRFIRSFGGYGSGPGRLMLPVDITATPDGGLLVSQMKNRFLSLFSADGGFIRRFSLEKEEQRQPFRLAHDSSGRLFVSFMDGGGISVYDAAGGFAGKIEAGKAAFKEVEKIRGFCITDDTLVVAGNGRFILADLDGAELKSTKSAGLEFGAIESIAADGNGKIYAADYGNNLLMETDSGLEKIKKVESVFTAGICGVAAAGGSLAVADTVGNSVRIYQA